MSSTLPRYVLITPARNEEAFIELTVRSMVAQTVHPSKWVIVSDGSTDRTDEIVKAYANRHEWMDLVRNSDSAERDFGGKARSFKFGYDRLQHLEYDLVGNLDADVSFEPDLFEVLLRKFAENPGLGVGGMPFTEGEGTYDYRFSSIEHVSGACQMFRRECFEEIGGYRPMKGGGIDVLAVLMARMNGWQTRSFPERVCFHHRSMGSAKDRSTRVSYRLGQKDYMLGRHPLWQALRSVYQMRRPPVVLGGMMLFCGYLSLALKRTPRVIPCDVIRFQRQEQLARLKGFLLRKRPSEPIVRHCV